MAATTGSLLQIGEVAERTGLSLRTVRHYEEVGLLSVAERSPGGFRLYTDAAVERLLVIKQLKPLDVTLEQMRELRQVTSSATPTPKPNTTTTTRSTVGFRRLASRAPR